MLNSIYHSQGVITNSLLTLHDTVSLFNDLGKKVQKKKTLWEKEKMLVTSIFSFSHNVFSLSKIKFQIFSHIYFVVCKCFQFGLV